MRKIESGSIRMSKPFGAVAPSLKPSVPLFYGGCTVLSIHPSTSVLSAQALAALKYAFLQNKKVGITGAKVESLKPPCNSDLAKAEAAYSIARELVEWSERFTIDDDEAWFNPKDRGCLETQDDHKMSDKAPDFVHSIDAKDEKDAFFGARLFGDVKAEIKDPEIKDPEVKLEHFDEFKPESRPVPYFEGNLDLHIKAEPASFTEKSLAVPAVARAVSRADTPETPNFLKDTGCDGFDFFKSERDTEYDALSLLSYSTSEPMSSLDDLTQHTVDIDLAFPVPPLPVYSKMDSDRFDDLYASIESPQSPFLLSPFSSPHSPLPSSFPDS
eukprot:TRINITY_DN1901_c0_g1_i26.p1 TRINITY_DN1901_c0_g1~~TRINITY_DN1901_c0_g1_i26.p1  ORF type:complete len:328 (+),score=40.27 TRINITY_DN1901_c0_g1_i26:272-1255(+)